MKNIVGQTPRGQDFFPRDAIINRIYRRLDGGAHIFLAAPRRVGKTSIMRFLEDNPRKGYYFVYVITESAHSSEEFFQRLLEEVLKSPAIGQLAKKKENIASLVKQVIGRIERIKFPWLEVDMERRKEETFQASFENLIREYDKEEGTLVIMIDEYPQTVENIKITHGQEEAVRFLRLGREQRQRADAGIRFLYTGSIGLPSVVKKLTSTSVINDLNVIDINPLSVAEARNFTQILLDNYQVQYSPVAIDYLLETINWLIPFHIQLAVQELIDVYENTAQPLEQGSVDQAISQLLNVRNDIYFEHYFARLKSIFHGPAYQFATAFLNQLANTTTKAAQAVREQAKQFEVEDVLDTVLSSLEYDGYIHFDPSQKLYRFNSYLLQQWWDKKNPK